MTNLQSGADEAPGLSVVPLSAELREQLSQRPMLAERFEDFQAAFTEEGLVEQRMLDLCRARVDALHQLDAAESALPAETLAAVRRGDFAALTPAEQQVLALTEQMLIDAHGVSAGQLDKLVAELGESAVVTLLTAAAMFDSNARMQRVLGPVADNADSTRGDS